MSFKSKLTVALAAACCALALSVGAAKADTFTTFDVSGTFAGGAGGTLSGTITFDITKLAIPTPDVPTTDVITAADILLTILQYKRSAAVLVSFFWGISILTSCRLSFLSLHRIPIFMLEAQLPTDLSTYAMYLAVLTGLPTSLAAALLQSPVQSSALACPAL